MHNRTRIARFTPAAASGEISRDLKRWAENPPTGIQHVKSIAESYVEPNQPVGDVDGTLRHDAEQPRQVTHPSSATGNARMSRPQLPHQPASERLRTIFLGGSHVVPLRIPTAKSNETPAATARKIHPLGSVRANITPGTRKTARTISATTNRPIRPMPRSRLRIATTLSPTSARRSAGSKTRRESSERTYLPRSSGVKRSRSFGTA